MIETRKELKIPGLYVIHAKCGSYKYCRLHSSKTNALLWSFSDPIQRITDFIELFNESLAHVDWDTDDYTEEHGKAIMVMRKRVSKNSEGNLITNIPRKVKVAKREPEVRKELNIPGLYVVNSYYKNKTFQLYSERHEDPLRYYNYPVKITDYIKLVNQSLAHLDWEVDEFTDEHRDAVKVMETKMEMDRMCSRYVINF